MKITFVEKKKKDRLEVNVTNLNMCLETMEIIHHITIPNYESMYNIIYSNSMSAETITIYSTTSILKTRGTIKVTLKPTIVINARDSDTNKFITKEIPHGKIKR